MANFEWESLLFMTFLSPLLGGYRNTIRWKGSVFSPSQTGQNFAEFPDANEGNSWRFFPTNLSWYPKNWPWKKSSCFDTQKYLYSVTIDNVYLERKMLGKFLPNKPSTNGCFFGRSRMEKLRMKQIGIQRWQSMTTTNRWSFNTPPFSTPFPPDVFSKNPPPVLERGHDIMTPSLDKFFWGAQLVH